MTGLIGPSIYLVIVSIGVVVNWQEFRRARWVYRELIKEQINGARQMIAYHFVWVAGVLFSVQCLLILPAIASFVAGPRSRADLSEAGAVVVVLSQWAHIAMVVLLTRLAIANRRNRERFVDAADADAVVKHVGKALEDCDD